jgi:hypothetical protein
VAAALQRGAQDTVGRAPVRAAVEVLQLHVHGDIVHPLPVRGAIVVILFSRDPISNGWRGSPHERCQMG